jgi:hypothetical protein
MHLTIDLSRRVCGKGDLHNNMKFNNYMLKKSISMHLNTVHGEL